jgi:hypothetical protein
MAADHLPPIGLNINEMIAVHTFLFVHDGETPPSPAQIRADHERFLPPGWQPWTPSRHPSDSHAIRGVVTGLERPEEMINRLGCGACHSIPSTAHRFGAIGPVLIAKTTAPARLASPEYQAAQVRTGKAHATTPKEYVIESIMHPDAYIVPGFLNMNSPDRSVMPSYSSKLTYEAADKLADFLLTLDESAAARDGITVDHDGRKKI